MKLHPRLTAQGVLLAQRAERFRPVAERDGRGWVVGYGHRAGARESAQVSEADAVALLAYDLSQTAARVESLLRRPAPPELFDTLNAYALRVGPEAFARSEVLRRANGAPSEGGLARDPAEAEPPSAVLAAAESVRDRVSQVLDTPAPPPPPRPRREPWPEPSPSASGSPNLDPADLGERRDPGDLASIPEDGEPAHLFGAVSPPESDPRQGQRAKEAAEVVELGREREPAADFPPQPMAQASGAEPAGSEVGTASVPPDAEESAFHGLADAVPPASAPAPVVSSERGGRARSWDRIRANPYVYTAVGACGLVLFACALLGFILGRPTGMGLALGVTGVICLAPALAFFLHRRGAPPS